MAKVKEDITRLRKDVRLLRIRLLDDPLSTNVPVWRQTYNEKRQQLGQLSGTERKLTVTN